MKHFVVGLMPNDAQPENNPLLYDAWLFKDIKTWNGAHRRAQRYAKTHGNLRQGMRPVLFAYNCAVVDGHTPPYRWSLL